MGNIIPFDFEGQAVRSTLINEVPWFAAADVCRVLEHSNPSAAVSRLDEDERGISNVYTPSGEQEMLVINESGLYSLLFTSRKAAAKRFIKWVTSEVLPTIRKTGGYNGENQEPESSPRNIADLQHLHDLINAQQEVNKLKDVVTANKNSNSNNIKVLAAILIENTGLSNEEIADQMEDVLGERIPEWVAWQRRKATG